MRGVVCSSSASVEDAGEDAFPSGPQSQRELCWVLLKWKMLVYTSVSNEVTQDAHSVFSFHRLFPKSLRMCLKHPK